MLFCANIYKPIKVLFQGQHIVFILGIVKIDLYTVFLHIMFSVITVLLLLFCLLENEIN